jgi:hypothetical protein
LLVAHEGSLLVEGQWRRALEVVWAPVACLDVLVQCDGAPRRGLFWSDGAWAVEAYLWKDRLHLSRALRNEVLISLVARGLGVGQSAAPARVMPRSLLAPALVLAPRLAHRLELKQVRAVLEAAGVQRAESLLEVFVELGALEQAGDAVAPAAEWAPYWRALATPDAASLELQFAHPSLPPERLSFFGAPGARALVRPCELEGVALVEFSFPGSDRLAGLISSRVTAG